MTSLEVGPGAFLYIKTYGKRPKDSYVADCPDGVDPRGPDSPYTHTYEETLGSDWDGDWCIVAAADPDEVWVGWDIDTDGDEHETVVEDPDLVHFDEDRTTVARTTNGFHAHTVWVGEGAGWVSEFDMDTPPGTDAMGDTLRLAISRSPWHDPEVEELHRGKKWTKRPDHRGQPMNFGDEADDAEDRGPVLVPPAHNRSAPLDLPDEPPEEVPLCAVQLAGVRTSGKRNEYGQSPWHADSHLGMVLLANGYSMGEAFEFFRDNPPAKEGGFDPDVTEYQLGMLAGKLESGALTPPRSTLAENGVDVVNCDCAVHGDRGRNGGGMAMPRAMSEEQAARSDEAEKQRAVNDLRRSLRQPIDGGLIYHAPQSLGKTVETAKGAHEQPRLVITTNKGEHREGLRYGASDAGVTVDEVTPFGESWLCSSASPVADECMDLYRQGVMPRFILSEFSDVVPEEVECPYIEQFEGEPPEADLLMGSPGHDTVARFRKMGRPGDRDPVNRAVVYDDVNPANRELEQNTFALDSARAELNELLQEIPELRSDSVAQLLADREDMGRVERVAVGDGSGDGEEEQADPDDVWEALELEAQRDDAIRLDLVDIVRRRENVRGDTVIKLKVVAGAEVRGIRPVSWESSSGGRMYSWVSHPNLEDHDVAVLSATHVPHVTEEWFRHTNAGPPEHRSATDDWKAVRRAQGYQLIQTNNARNSRSGAGAGADDPEARANTMKERRDKLAEAIGLAEGVEPGVIDSKRLLGGCEHDSINLGRVWSNNKFRQYTVGLVSGATYFGDEWVEARAAYCGEDIEVEHPDGEPASCDNRIGSDLLDFMVKATVEQAVTRFGRDDGVGSKVYVDTREVPPDFPTIDISDDVVFTTEAQQEAVEAVADGCETIEEIAQRLDVTRRQTGNVLWELEEMGIIEIKRFALEYGRHRVSGSPGISINKVILPETDRPGPERELREAPDTKDQTTGGSATVQISLEDFSGPPS